MHGSELIRLSGRAVRFCAIFTMALLLCVCAEAATDPVRDIDFSKVDKIVAEVPEAQEETIEKLVAYLGQYHQRNEALGVRMITKWIADNISYDVQEFKNKTRGRNKTAEEVFATRTCICGGYANLFIRMCELMGLKAAKVVGYSKGYGYTPDSDVKDNSHAWNAVLIRGKSYLVDPTWASGHIDDKDKFVPEWNEFYFLANPDVLILTHWPQEAQYQLLRQPVSLEQFVESVYLHPRFFRYGLEIESHRKGLIEVDEEVAIKLRGNNRVQLRSSVSRNGEKIADDLSFVQNPDGHITVNAAFPSPGLYKVNIFAKYEEEPGSYGTVACYHVKVRKGLGDKAGFVRTYKMFAEKHCQLQSPMRYYLKEGSRQTFKIKIPDAISAYLYMGEKRLAMKRGLYFELSTVVEKGDATIFAEFQGDANGTGIVSYKVY